MRLWHPLHSCGEGWGGEDLGMTKPVTLNARRLRRNMIDAEQHLWRHLRGR
ncbi:MAG: DUF559 domain-containing protein [Hydrogenophilaceae bacterium]|nr:DUF559 domain-containing protein [Hydrogenophilaceae bacterium]